MIMGSSESDGIRIRGGIGTGGTGFFGEWRGRLSDPFCKVRGFWAFSTGRSDNWGDMVYPEPAATADLLPFVIEWIEQSFTPCQSSGGLAAVAAGFEGIPQLPRGVRGFQPVSRQSSVLLLKAFGTKDEGEALNSPPLARGGRGGRRICTPKQ